MPKKPSSDMYFTIENTDGDRAVSVKTVLNVAQIFVELHLISPTFGK